MKLFLVQIEQKLIRLETCVETVALQVTQNLGFIVSLIHTMHYE
jgi:hypothetical protein